MNIIYFFYNKLIDNGISKFTALGCHLLLTPPPPPPRTSQNF